MKTTVLLAGFLLLNGAIRAQQLHVASGKSDWVRVSYPVPAVEDWLQTKGWFVGENAEGILRKTPTFYEIKPKRPDAWSVILPGIDLPTQRADFLIRVTLKFQENLPCIAGLVIGADDRDNYLTLRINDLGQFLLQQYVEGKELWTNKEYRPSEAIRTQADNVLELRVSDNTVIKAFINGKGVATESYRSVTSSRIGLITSGQARFADFTFNVLP